MTSGDLWSALALRPAAIVTTAAALSAILGCGFTCGPFLTTFHCVTNCPAGHRDDGLIGGALACICRPDPTSSLPGHRLCNTHLPQGFGPDIPSFAPLPNDTALENVTLAGFKEIRSIRSDSFAVVARWLTVLRLSRNAIDTLEPGAFAGLITLRHLDLSHNKLSDDSVPGLPTGADTPNLEELDLKGNEIFGLSLSRLSCLTKLRRLDVSHNRILTIAGPPSPPSPYSAPLGLRELNIGHGMYANSISECDAHVLCSVLNLTSLSMTSTSWRCDCDVYWLMRVYNACAVVGSVEAVECFEPDAFYRRMRRSVPVSGMIPVTEFDVSDCTYPDPASVSQRCPFSSQSCAAAGGDGGAAETTRVATAGFAVADASTGSQLGSSTGRPTTRHLASQGQGLAMSSLSSLTTFPVSTSIPTRSTTQRDLGSRETTGLTERVTVSVVGSMLVTNAMTVTAPPRSSSGDGGGGGSDGRTTAGGNRVTSGSPPHRGRTEARRATAAVSAAAATGVCAAAAVVALAASRFRLGCVGA